MRVVSESKLLTRGAEMFLGWSAAKKTLEMLVHHHRPYRYAGCSGPIKEEKETFCHISLNENLSDVCSLKLHVHSGRSLHKKDEPRNEDLNVFTPPLLCFSNHLVALLLSCSFSHFETDYVALGPESSAYKLHVPSRALRLSTGGKKIRRRKKKASISSCDVVALNEQC